MVEVDTIPFSALREKILALGWQDAAVTTATVSEANIAAYRAWLHAGHHGHLAYMENQMRCFPKEFFPGAQSAILCVSYYRGETLPFREDAGLIASYARGKDYHHVHRKRLKALIQWMEEKTGMQEIAKPFSDSAPVLEKALAVQAGLGWFGKNTLLIHRRFGTFILLSGIMTSLRFSDTKEELQLPRCGSCKRCLDACPTSALIDPYTLDARKCLSYHLIESKEEIPEWVRKANPGYAFGCDICQDACPHNWKKPVTETVEFLPSSGIGAYLTEERMGEIEQDPTLLFGTPLQRRKAVGLRRNLESLK